MHSHLRRTQFSPQRSECDMALVKKNVLGQGKVSVHSWHFTSPGGTAAPVR